MKNFLYTLFVIFSLVVSIGLIVGVLGYDNKYCGISLVVFMAFMCIEKLYECISSHNDKRRKELLNRLDAIERAIRSLNK